MESTEPWTANSPTARSSRGLIRAVSVSVLVMVWAVATVLGAEDIPRRLAAAIGHDAEQHLAALSSLIRIALILLGTVAALLAAFLTRRRPLGGWLLLFYLSLGAGAINTLIQSPATLQGLRPSEWDNANLYAWNLADISASVLLQVAALTAASILLVRRELRYVRVLSAILIAQILYGLTIPIAVAFFAPFNRESLGRIDGAIYALIRSTAWYLYFLTSARIRLVFVKHAWSYDAQRRLVGHRTARERGYLFVRAAAAAAVTYAFAFVLNRIAFPGNERSLHDVITLTLALAAPGATLAASVSCLAPIGERMKGFLGGHQAATQA
jgi:hypothetical protein